MGRRRTRSRSAHVVIVSGLRTLWAQTVQRLGEPCSTSFSEDWWLRYASKVGCLKEMMPANAGLGDQRVGMSFNAWGKAAPR